MSDESISHKEDKEDLLYIARKIHMEQFTYTEEHMFMRESLNSQTSVASDHGEITESDTNLLNTKKQTTAVGPQIFKDPSILLKTRPFELVWSFGINPKVNIINLTTTETNKIFFASSHFPIIYDYCQKKMNYLEGHHHFITSTSVDKSGKWIVTADNGEDGFLNIWDGTCKMSESDKIAPVLSMYSVYTKYGINTVQISPSARYLITIGGIKDDVYSVDMWLWTLGNDVPDDSYRISNIHGYPVMISYNPNIEEHIMIVFSKQVFLLMWDKENKKFVNQVTPQIMHRGKIGHLTSGTYVNKCHECYTSSSKGCLLVFGNTLYARPFEEGELDNNKIFRNAVKISEVSIDCCTTIDGLVVTGDTLGRIYFFTKRLMILYWLTNFNLGPISSISFNLIPKLKLHDMNTYLMVPTKEEEIMNCDFLDMVEELEVLFQQNLPTDATMDRAPFIVRDFFVATAHCNVYAIDVVNNKCISLFHTADDYVAAIEAHEESDFIIIAYKSNRIILMNYKTKEVISENTLPKEEEETATISCIKYSSESFHLVCGKTSGEIWVLEPILLNPKYSFQVTKNNIMKIRFSSLPLQFAYYDDKRTVVIFAFNTEKEKWECSGKIRPHYGNITDLMFIPTKNCWKLYTIAKDRHIIEYNNDKLDQDEFTIESSERIEQTAVPLSFIYWVSVVGEKQLGYILLSDDNHKLKFLYQTSKIPKSLVLAPAFGCFKNQLIRKMQIIPHCSSKYMAFATKRHFGLHILPPDGNPYKYVGYLAHPVKLEDFVLSRCGKYIFTFGENDHCVIKWRIETKSVEMMKRIGGNELEPFYCLIEGGYHGWLFHEIKDLFYYMQILQQENIDLPRRVTDSINISEIPDLFRTIGFYPSDFELENIMIDVKFRNMDETNKINEDINFIDFVKLFCNHKPVYGYSQADLINAFSILLDNAHDENYSYSIKKEKFIEFLTTQGEALSVTNACKLFNTLMRCEKQQENFDFLPERIDFHTFVEDILGIDMERDKVLETEDSTDDESESIELKKPPNKTPGQEI